MTVYGTESGIAITTARVHSFRSLANVEVDLTDLTVIIGANNAGKTSFLDALFAAVGSGRKSLGLDDVRLAPGEATAPKTRQIIIDLMLRPVGDDGKVIESYPEGSFWTSVWGTPGIANDDDLNEFTPIRTTLKWSDMKGEYVVERKFLKEWKPFANWTTAETHDRALSAAQMEPLALHYVDAKRDLDDDLRRPGSFWRKMTEDLGLSDADIATMEGALSAINQEIVDKSNVLKHLRENLAGLQTLVSADSGGSTLLLWQGDFVIFPRVWMFRSTLLARSLFRLHATEWGRGVLPLFWYLEPTHPGAITRRQGAGTMSIQCWHWRSQNHTCIHKLNAHCLHTSKQSLDSASLALIHRISQVRHS